VPHTPPIPWLSQVALLEDFDASVREAAAATIAAIASHGQGTGIRVASTSDYHAPLAVHDPSSSCICPLCHAAQCYADLGSAIVDSGAVALLVVCLQEPDVALKRACALALAEIANFAVDVCVCSSPMVALLVIFCSGAVGWFLLLHGIACCFVLCA
jgi:hypothetical protein